MTARVMLIFGFVCVGFARFPPPILEAYSQSVATVAIAAAITALVEGAFNLFWDKR